MHPSHRRWLREDIEIDAGDGTTAKDDYGLIPEDEWTQVLTARASIMIMGGSEDLTENREQQANRYTIVIEPPKYTKISNDMRVRFRGRDGIVETVLYKYDHHGVLDRVSLVVREAESSGTEHI